MPRELVYPGHPIHLALEVMALFPSVKAAEQIGRQFSVALEDHRIPGAGSAVGTAIALLRIAEERDNTPEGLFVLGKEWWNINRKTDHSENIDKGNAQADELKEEFISTLSVWLERPEGCERREYLPRSRIVEGYVLPHAYKRELSHDLDNSALLKEAASIIGGFSKANEAIAVKLDEQAQIMDNTGWYMTGLTMRSAAHYIRNDLKTVA